MCVPFTHCCVQSLLITLPCEPSVYLPVKWVTCPKQNVFPHKTETWLQTKELQELHHHETGISSIINTSLLSRHLTHNGKCHGGARGKLKESQTYGPILWGP